jgi:2'-5' RNA ligase
MNMQLPLAAPPTPPRQAELAHRLYFAIQPDGLAAEQIAPLSEALAQRFRGGARAVAVSRLHVSLNFVGRDDGPPPAEVVAGAGMAASRVAMAPFLVSFDRLVSWKGRAGHRPLVLTGGDGAQGVDRLRRRLRAALVGGGLRPGPERAFVPHMTLLWGDHDLTETAVAPVRWRVREFVLLHSGAGRQAVLGRWPLLG